MIYRGEGVQIAQNTFRQDTIVCGTLILSLRIETRSNLLFEVALPGEVPGGLTIHCIKEAKRKLSEYEIPRPTHLRAADFVAALMDIPEGTTLTYGHLAKRLGSSPRGIASRCSANRLLIRIPCHRVISNQGIGGYNAGIDWKKALLRLEAKSRFA